MISALPPGLRQIILVSASDHVWCLEDVEIGELTFDRRSRPAALEGDCELVCVCGIHAYVRWRADVALSRPGDDHLRLMPVRAVAEPIETLPLPGRGKDCRPAGELERQTRWAHHRAARPLDRLLRPYLPTIALASVNAARAETALEVVK